MNGQKVLRFHGSKADLNHLKKALSAGGIEQQVDNTIRASDDLHTASILFFMRVGIGMIVKAYLLSRRKIIVSRHNLEGEERIEINGSYSADEIEKALAKPHNLDIKNAPKQLKKLARKTRLKK